jgi:hypothetical protein
LGKEKKTTLLGLKNLLPQVSQHRGWQEQLELHSVFLAWEDLLDKEITAHCKPLKIVKKVLWAEVENSAWLQQFQYQSAFILRCLNQSLDTTKLKGIRFYVAEKEFEGKKKQTLLRYVPPPATELADFEEQVSSIVDKDSREALLRFWYLSKACKRE